MSIRTRWIVVSGLVALGLAAVAFVLGLAGTLQHYRVVFYGSAVVLAALGGAAVGEAYGYHTRIPQAIRSPSQGGN